MKMSRAMVRAALTLGLVCSLPAAAQAAVIYNQIIVYDRSGTVLASVTATPAEIAADPNTIYYVSGIATDPGRHGDFSTVVDDDGNPFEIFGAVDGGPDGNDLGFALQGVASGYFVQHPHADNGAPIDLTDYLSPSLRILDGDTATFFATGLDAAVPEPLTWAMMVVGFGIVGYGMRSQPQRRVLARC